MRLVGAPVTNDGALATNGAPAIGDGAAKFAAFTPMNDQPGLADRKATFVLATSGLLLSTTFFFAPRLATLLPVTTPRRAFILVALPIAVVLIIAAVRHAYAAFILSAPPRPDNPLFYQNVAARDHAGYERAVFGVEQSQTLRLLLDYNYTMALLGAKKFSLVGKALWYLRIALPIWMMLLLMMGLKPS